MMLAACLALYGMIVAAAAPRLLPRLTGMDRAPRLGVALWSLVVVSVLGSWMSSGLLMLYSAAGLSGHVSDLLRSCMTAVHTLGLSAPLAAVSVALASAVVAVGLGRLTWRIAGGWWRAHQSGLQHARAVRVAGHSAPHLGQDVVVLDHPEVAVYCVAGPRRTVVLTRAAMKTLSTDALQAVLAHEHAHLAGRHHLLLTLARSCRRALPRLLLFHVAHDQIARLLEMRADDVAVCRHGRTSLVAGLVAMSSRPVPAGSLGATGPSVLARAVRLTDPPSRSERAVAHVTLAMSLAVAAALPGVPLLTMALRTCPIMLGS